MSRLSRSLVRLVDRYEASHTPRPRVRFIWLSAEKPPFEQQRDEWIASGLARPTDIFRAIHWRDYTPPKAS